jgi:hypothetical protein
MIGKYSEDNSNGQTAIDLLFKSVESGDLVGLQNEYRECNNHANPKTAFN